MNYLQAIACICNGAIVILTSVVLCNAIRRNAIRRNAFAQADAPAALPNPAAPGPFTLTECEGINNCATWTFLGTLLGSGQWPTGEIANLYFESVNENTLIFRLMII